MNCRLDTSMTSSATSWQGPVNVLSLILLAMSTPPAAHAWERVALRGGAEIEGQIEQESFALKDRSGGEILVPRAALSSFEVTPAGLKAKTKDGKVITGSLVGSVEIEDGQISRRYSPAEIQHVDFDRYIPLPSGRSTGYESCPIRVELTAGGLFTETGRTIHIGQNLPVTCQGLQILSVDLAPETTIRAGKPAVVTAAFFIRVPPGEDQRMDLSARLTQGGDLVCESHEQRVIDEGKRVHARLRLEFPGERLARAGPTPRLLVQLVTQDESRETPNGGWFWWYTVGSAGKR